MLINKLLPPVGLDTRDEEMRVFKFAAFPHLILAVLFARNPKL